jgi:predicted dehydrogenase
VGVGERREGDSIVLRGAIIGIGKIAQTGHLLAFNDERIRGRAGIVAAVDPSKESRQIATQRFPQLRLYETTKQLFEEEHVDFIDICTTPQFHGALIEAAVRHKVHILCEKPFALSPHEASRIADLLRESDKILRFVPCHQYRYSPVWQQFNAFLAGTASHNGSLLQFNVFRTEADPGLHAANTIWRTNRDVSGGGILADTGVHYLYLTLWMLGMPQRLTARIHQLTRTNSGVGAVEDTAVVVLEYGNSLAEITLTWGADRRANSARLVNTQGSMVYDGKSLVRHVGEKSETLPVPDASDKTQYVSLYVSLIGEFIDAIHSSKSSSQWIDEAHQSVKLLHACYHSAESGRTVTLD